MKTSRIHNVVLILAGALLLGALFARLARQRESFIATPYRSIAVTLAQDKVAWEQGLSGTVSLEPHTGKLFIFDKPDLYGFWMKDMEYPIDIIWIDESQTVVAVTVRATPESYPEVFYPPSPVQYVLEMNAGDATFQHLSVGTKINIGHTVEK